MDHLVVALLNTAREAPDPLETPLGTARWWAALERSGAFPLAASKPRFDAALASALRDLRAEAARLVGGEGALSLCFRGDASDAVLFELIHALCRTAMEAGCGRIRECGSRACGRYFLDETKNGSKRWCSLRCMERARTPRRRTISR